MHRFFLPPNLFSQSEVTFPEDTARQMRSVLRLKPGQRVLALDNQGFCYTLELTEVGARVRAALIERQPARGEPAVRLTLYLSLTQREKFEGVLQKGSELGAAGFVPVITSRSLVQDSASPEKKGVRWQRILQEAAEQSGRGRIPELGPTLHFDAALRAARNNNRLALIPWEGESRLSLRAALAGAAGEHQIGVFIGPEGGFSEEEIARAREAGVQPVTLGPRILRMETAALAAVALVMAQMGEME
jgi:16S rRNA (uracil1498-N3)-methyltransferase